MLNNCIFKWHNFKSLLKKFKKFLCLVCFSFNSVIHYIYVGLKNHNCNLCDKDFGLPGDLKRHINIVHEGMKNHKCDQCDKAFSKPANLKTHINSVHKKLKNYKCEICDHSFSESGTLKRHIKIHHKVEILLPLPIFH